MAERNVLSADGHEWSADEFALCYGHLHTLEQFAKIMDDVFRVHGYERMQQLFDLREKALTRNFSGTIPEGGDINDFIEL